MLQDNALIWCRACLLQGVQLLLDGVVEYLPNPLEVSNHALDQNKNEEKVCVNTFNHDISMISWVWLKSLFADSQLVLCTSSIGTCI